MTNSMTNAQAFVKLGRRVRELRSEYAHSKTQLTALNKAAVNLMACRWKDYGHALKIESATTAGQWYWVDEDGCQCAAPKVCWHREAFGLVQAMNDDGSDDNRGSFTDDTSADGFVSKLETVVRVSPGERAAAEMEERVTDADMEAAYADLCASVDALA